MSSVPTKGEREGELDLRLLRIAPQLRRARPEDGEGLAPMFLGIWQGMHLKLPWDDMVSLRAMGKSIRAGEGRFRWQNDVVWEEGGQIYGVVCCYPGEEEQRFSDEFLPYIQREGGDPANLQFPLESRPGEQYLDSLFVLPGSRGKGAGSDLLRAAMMQTALLDRPLVLNVDRRNARALALYRRMGFVTFDTRVLAGHANDTMRYTPVQARREFAAVFREET